MFVLEVVIGAALLITIAVLVTRGEPLLDDETPDLPEVGLPLERPLRSDDIARLRFRVVAGIRGIRGYRFADVDATLAKVEESLRAHERAAAVPPAGAGEPMQPEQPPRPEPPPGPAEPPLPSEPPVIPPTEPAPPVKPASPSDVPPVNPTDVPPTVPEGRPAESDPYASPQ